MKRLSGKDLLDLRSLPEAELRLILEQAAAFDEIARRPVKKVPALRGKTVINLFFEPSTRTATSFHLSAQRLSADMLDVRVADSSVKKGETLLDTAATFDAMGLAVLIMRGPHAGAPRLVANYIKASVINAGDGMHEHPTQGLLDAFTIIKRQGSVEGKTIAIVGDVLHSRVARSDTWAFLKLGAREVRLCGPVTMCPESMQDVFKDPRVKVSHDLKAALEGADVVQMLRLQLERQARFLFPSTREYSRAYGLTSEKLAWAKPGALVMHPGPMNRGLEISSGVADGPQSAITEQVGNGVAVRMAVLYLLAGNEDQA
jgi:aspartate carbamoyltransferase catalytic subunit